MTRDMELLAERLTLRYGLSTAKKIMLSQKDRLWTYHGVAWALGKRDFYFFNMYFLQDVYVGEGKAELAPIHHKMWSIINDMYIKDTHDRQVFVLPRGTGKSLTGSVPTSIWANLYGYSKYTVVASAVNDTALSFINNIRSALVDNERIDMAFGRMYNERLVNKTDRIELANKTMIQALPSKSSFRGKSYLGTRIQLLILDDFQSDENVSSKDQKAKHWKKFSDDSANAIEKNNYKMIAMGTIMEKDDFYDRLLKTPTWKHLTERAILVEDIDIMFNSGLWLEFKNILFNNKDKHRLDNAKQFYYQHMDDMQYPLLWQDYWCCLEVALGYYENPVSFKQEMQLEVDTTLHKKFTNVVTLPQEEIMTRGSDRDILVIDPAGNETKGKNTDYYTFAVGSVDPKDNVIYVKKSYMKRFDFNEYIDFTIDIIVQFPNIDTVIIEKQTYNGADVIALKDKISRDMDLYYRNIEWINNHQTKNKDNKINTIVGDVNMGKIVFNAEDVDPLDQLKAFTTCKTSLHDDYPDVIAELALYCKDDSQDNKVQILTL